MKRSLKKGLPGGPNEKVFSKEGYRNTSSDVNNAYNIIPSGNITMKEKDGTPLKKGPLMGTDNLGNSQIMFPGADYQFPGNMVTETPLAKKGGPFQNSNIYATNKLFVKNPLFKKRKKGKKAKGVYNPKAKYTYDDGGESGCPEGYAFNPKTGECIEWNPTVWNSEEQPTSFDPIADVIYMNPNDRPEGISDEEYDQMYQDQLEHEQLHRLQWINDGLKGESRTPLRMPSTVDNQDYPGDHYYNRRQEEVNYLHDYWKNQHPNEAEFIPDEIIYDKETNPAMYQLPWTVEGEARNYEYATHDGMQSLFPKKEKGGSIHLELDDNDIDKYVKGGYVVEEINEYKEGGDKRKQRRNRWKNVTEKNPNPEPTKTPIDPRYLEQHPDTAPYYLNQPEVALTPRGKNWITSTPGYAGVYINPDTGKLEQDKSKLATGSVEMVYPEKYVIGPGGGLVGAGIKGLEKISAAAIPGLANIPGATIGNALGAGFAADAIVNRLPEIPGQIQAGDYSGALINAGTAGLDILGANIGTGLIKNIGNTSLELSKPLLNYGTDVIETSKVAGKLQLPKYKDVYRVEHAGFNKNATSDDLMGRWFADNPLETKFYVDKLKDPITGEVITNTDVPVRVLKKRLPEYKVNQNFGAGMPEEARIMSMGKGDFTNTQLDDLLGPGAGERFTKGKFTEQDYNAMSSAPFLFRKQEGILDPNLVNDLRNKGNIFNDKEQAIKYLFNEAKNIEEAKNIDKYLPPVLSNLSNAPVTNKLKNFFDRPLGPLMIGLGQMSNFNKEIKNPDYYLDVMKLNKYSPKQKKYFEDLIESVKSQGNVATEKQYDELQRIKTGNMNYGKKGYKKGGALLTKKVTCKKCGWTWDAADGGNDLTTCHKCGGQGLIHAQNGGYINDISIPSLNRMDDGGVVAELPEKKIKELIKQGYIIEEID